MTKYDTFFETVKSFALENNISTSNDFVGAQESEILKLEEKLDFNFKLGMRKYLSYFGHRIGIQNFGLTRFTIENIFRAEEIAQKHKIRDKILKGRLVDGWHEKPIENKLKQICFVNYFEINYYFTFIDENHENPILFAWDGGDKSYKHRMSITSNLRGQIFTGLKSICDVRREKQKKKLSNSRLDFYERTKEINIEGLAWLDIIKEKYIDRNLYVSIKRELEKEISIIEAKENRIIGLNEYGEKFEIMLNKKAA